MRFDMTYGFLQKFWGRVFASELRLTSGNASANCPLWRAEIDCRLQSNSSSAFSASYDFQASETETMVALFFEGLVSRHSSSLSVSSSVSPQLSLPAYLAQPGDVVSELHRSCRH